MPEGAKLLIFVCCFAALLCFAKMVRSGHIVKAFAVSSVSGVGSLFAVNLITFITGIKLSINWFTLIFCSFTGIGGSVFLLLINAIKNIK